MSEQSKPRPKETLAVEAAMGSDEHLHSAARTLRAVLAAEHPRHTVVGE